MFRSLSKEGVESCAVCALVHIRDTRLLGDEKQPKLIPGLRRGRFKNRDFEAFTISWAPHDFGTNPVCVFLWFRQPHFSDLEQMSYRRREKFLRLDETLKIALNEKGAVGVWGPYEIKKAGFDLGVKRKLFLDGGKIKYKADDRLTRKDLVAINCFHAMANLEQLYPSGGFLRDQTGFKMWGIDGTARVLIEYTKAVRDQRTSPPRAG